MTGNKILLDTNVIIDLFKGDEAIFSLLQAHTYIYIPAAVLGELYLGAYRSTNQGKHLLEVRQFLVICTILNADRETAEKYGIIKADLLRKGKPIPENDIWIAATALQHQLPLYTRDKHFSEVDGITLA